MVGLISNKFENGHTTSLLIVGTCLKCVHTQRESVMALTVQRGGCNQGTFVILKAKAKGVWLLASIVPLA